MCVPVGGNIFWVEVGIKKYSFIIVLRDMQVDSRRVIWHYGPFRKSITILVISSLAVVALTLLIAQDFCYFYACAPDSIYVYQCEADGYFYCCDPYFFTTCGDYYCTYATQYYNTAYLVLDKTRTVCMIVSGVAFILLLITKCMFSCIKEAIPVIQPNLYVPPPVGSVHYNQAHPNANPTFNNFYNQSPNPIYS